MNGKTIMPQITYPIVEAGNTTPVGRVTASGFVGDGQAYATGRVLAGTDDHGFEQEWAEKGILVDGRKAEAIYLFEAGDCDGEELDSYPWSKRLARFRLIAE